MTKEEIIKSLNTLDKYEKEAFFNNLDIDIDKIIKINDIELVEYDWNIKNYRCWIDTEKSCYQYYFTIEAKPILSNDVNIALNKFIEYLGGEKIFKDAFYDFEEKKVYFKVNNSNNYQINLRTLDSTTTLLDAFLWMKNYIIEDLYYNNCDWENEHNNFFGKYVEFLKPIFTVIDQIYNLKPVYTLNYN